MIKIRMLLALSLSLLLCACGKTSLVAATGPDSDNGGYFVSHDHSVAQIMQDTNISGRINTAYFADPLINTFNINVETYNGVVVLGGVVPSPSVAQRAVQIAEHTKGVKEVVAELTVRTAI